jgi:hypothetical protein
MQHISFTLTNSIINYIYWIWSDGVRNMRFVILNCSGSWESYTVGEKVIRICTYRSNPHKVNPIVCKHIYYVHRSPKLPKFCFQVLVRILTTQHFFKGVRHSNHKTKIRNNTKDIWRASPTLTSEWYTMNLNWCNKRLFLLIFCETWERCSVGETGMRINTYRLKRWNRVTT